MYGTTGNWTGWLRPLVFEPGMRVYTGRGFREWSEGARSADTRWGTGGVSKLFHAQTFDSAPSGTGLKTVSSCWVRNVRYFRFSVRDKSHGDHIPDEARRWSVVTVKAAAPDASVRWVPGSDCERLAVQSGKWIITAGQVVITVRGPWVLTHHLIPGSRTPPLRKWTRIRY